MTISSFLKQITITEIVDYNKKLIVIIIVS